MIMGTGIFIVLCGLTYMLEVKDSKNRHFIIGDCYNNFIYNADPSRSSQPLKKLRLGLAFDTKLIKYSCLPTIVSTMQATLSQRDHDVMLGQKVDTDSVRNSTRHKNKRKGKCMREFDF